MKESKREITGKLAIQLFDEKGNLLTAKEKISRHQFDVSKLSAGSYYCRIYVGSSYILKKFVKL